MSTATEQEPVAPPPAPSQRTPRRWFRRILRVFLLIVVPVIAILIGLQIYISTGRYVETDNAYVKSRLHTISPEIDGRVKSVLARENDQVKTGQLLLELDPEPIQIALEAAKAELEVARQDLRTRQAAYRQAEVEIELAREAIRFRQRQHQRHRHLRGKGVASATRMDESEHELKNARQGLRVALEKRSSIYAELDGKLADNLAQHPLIRHAQAKIKAAMLDLKRTRILAPITGVLAKINPEPGEVITANKAIGLVVEAGNVWIEANLKETQLTHIKVGQTASFTVDAYPGVDWQAKVSSIAPATGAEFALLPAQNASGNWVKFVQRLPVRLLVNEPVKADGGKQPTLRAGMTVSLSIDTKQSRELPAFVSQFLAYARGSN